MARRAGGCLFCLFFFLFSRRDLRQLLLEPRIFLRPHALVAIFVGDPGRFHTQCDAGTVELVKGRVQSVLCWLWGEHLA